MINIPRTYTSHIEYESDLDDPGYLDYQTDLDDQMQSINNNTNNNINNSNNNRVKNIVNSYNCLLIF